MNTVSQPDFEGILDVHGVPVSLKLVLPKNVDYMRNPILEAAQSGKLLECLDGKVPTLLSLTRSQVRALRLESSGPGTGVRPPHGVGGWIRYTLLQDEKHAREYFHSYSTLGGSEGHLINRIDKYSPVSTYQRGLRNAFTQWISQFSNNS